MGLAPGQKLGPYEIQSPLGAGGMGEVYGARDTRLERRVAVKVLPPALASDGDRLKRFEHEAHILSSLNHPNLLTIYDVGSQDGIQYFVSEFLEGQTLRELLRHDRLGVRKATDYGLQIAKGLAAAHEKGIVHRDLKPENIFVTNDDRVKILDFGLAKLSPTEKEEASGMTMTVQTVPGVVLGTVGYMSPEQVRGQATDGRSDLFAFGAILYEMLSGRRAFQGATPADTMSTILKEDPPEATETGRQVPPALESIVRHCLEKNPQRRFQSAQDLSFHLEQLSHSSGSGTALVATPSARNRPGLWPLLAVIALMAVGAAAGFFAGQHTTRKPSFRQLTFQRGSISQARFSPDGQTILYSAAWNDQPSDVYSTRADRPGARSLDLKGDQVAAVSWAGDLAVLTKITPTGTFVDTGTLAIVPLSGGAPREVAERVQYADFSPDGTQLAIVRDLGPRSRLEYPVGTSVYEVTGWLSHPRISPRGDWIAFVEHPQQNDDFGSLVVTDTHGHRRVLEKNWYELMDLAWSPRGDEIWFSANEPGSRRSLYAISLDGKRRPLLESPGNLVLKDVYRDGRILLVQENQRRELSGILAGESKEQNFSWFDWTVPNDISQDGKIFLFHEAGAGGGLDYAQFLRKTDGSTPILLGPGNSGALSPDGKWVLCLSAHSPAQVFLYPTGAGEKRDVTHDSIDHLELVWLPDGKSFISLGVEPNHNTRLYLQDLAGGPAKAISPEGYGAYDVPVSADGKYFVAQCLDLRPCLLPLSGSEPREIPNTDVTDIPIQWGEDGRSLFTYRFGPLPATIELIDVFTGKRRPWKTVAPADLAGVHGISLILMTRDARVCLYSYLRTFSDLYMVQGIK
ncbi:MAG TPA: protein kinase [Terriglobales bacterium]|nr:protein kinase [Terriglobales bacterium]